MMEAKKKRMKVKEFDKRQSDKKMKDFDVSPTKEFIL